MKTTQRQIIKRIGQLANRAKQEEQERKLLYQQQDRLIDELEQLIEAVFKISRSPRLRAQAESAQKVLTANTQKTSKVN